MGDAGELVCGICLGEQGPGAEIGELDCCNHLFCFPCVHRWAAIENTCPFCKLRFATMRRKQLASAEELSGADRNAPLPGRYLEQQAVEERNQRVVFEDPDFQQWIEAVACLVCGGGDDEDQLLLCDECDRACHTYCAGVHGIPEGDWFCPECQEGRAAAAADGWRRRRRAPARPQQREPQPAAGRQRGRQRAQQQAGRRRGRGELQEEEEIVDLLSSEEELWETDEEEEGEDEAAAQQRPAQRRRMGASTRQRQGGRRRGSRRAGSAGGPAAVLDGFIVDDSEEEDGDADWVTRRGGRGRQRPAAGRGSGRSLGRGGSRAATSRRGGQQQLGDSFSEEELELLESEDDGGSDEDLPLIRRLEARVNVTAAGNDRRGRSTVAGSARTAGAARQQAQGGSGQPAAVVTVVGPTSGPTDAHRRVDELRNSWEALRSGAASFSPGPSAVPASIGAAAAAASGAAAPSRGQRAQQQGAAGGAGARRRRLVRAGELEQGAAGAGSGGHDLDFDPVRQRAVATLRAQQAATAAAAGAAGGSSRRGQPAVPIFDLTSPSPQGARGGEWEQDAELAWRARGAALLEENQQGGQRQRERQRRRRISDSSADDADAYLNQSLAARLREQIAACRETGRRLLPRDAREPAAAAAGAAAAGLRSPWGTARGTEGQTAAATAATASPTPPGSRRHARSVGDYVFAANVVRGTPGGASRAAGGRGPGGARRPSGPFIIPRRLPGQSGGHGEAVGVVPHLPPSPQQQQAQQRQQYPCQRQQVRPEEGGELQREAENSRPLSGQNLPWQERHHHPQQRPQPQPQPQLDPQQRPQQQQQQPCKAPTEPRPANLFSRYSLQPSNRGSSSGSQQAAARPPAAAAAAAAALARTAAAAALAASADAVAPFSQPCPAREGGSTEAGLLQHWGPDFYSSRREPDTQQAQHGRWPPQQLAQGPPRPSGVSSGPGYAAACSAPPQHAAPPTSSAGPSSGARHPPSLPSPGPSTAHPSGSQPRVPPAAPGTSPRFPSEEWPGFGQRPASDLPVPSSDCISSRPLPFQQQATPPSAAGPGQGQAGAELLVIPSSTPPASRSRGEAPLGSQGGTWPSSSLEHSLPGSSGRGQGPGSSGKAGPAGERHANGHAGAGGERPSKQEVYERVKVQLKGQYKQRQISKEQYKQVAREATHQLYCKGTLGDADVEAAVRHELSKLQHEQSS